MLYLEQTRNRVIFMTASLAATVTLMATIHGINAVGVLFAAAIINIIIYYTLPDRYSQAYVQKKKNYFN